MNHLGTMLDSNLDDLVASQVSSDGGILSTLSNDICLIGLCEVLLVAIMTHSKSSQKKIERTLPVHGETVLITAKISKGDQEACIP